MINLKIYKEKKNMENQFYLAVKTFCTKEQVYTCLYMYMESQRKTVIF